MTTLRHIAISLIEYRPNVLGSDARVPLGVVLGGRSGRASFVMLTARNELSAVELEAFDPIGKELLARPFQFFHEQLKRALVGTKSPEEGLANFSARNQWSIFVSVPVPRELQISAHTTKLITVRTVLRQAHVMHQAGADPFATTMHVSPGTSPIGLSRFNEQKNLWADRGARGQRSAAG